MRKLLTSFILSFFIISSCFSQDILKKDGRYVNKNNELFTGIYKEYYENGKLNVEMSLKDGLQDGKKNIYYENEEKKEKR